MDGRGAAIFVASFTVVLLTLGAGYWVWQTYTPPTSAAPPVVPEVRQISLHLLVMEAGEATVRRWMPATVVVNVGDTVVLRVTNHDPENAHGFALAGFHVWSPPIRPGETRTLRFRASRPGVFHFGCSVDACAPDHADQTGQLVVLGHP